MDYYKNEVERAYKAFLSGLVAQYTITEAISKIRGSYGQAIANTVEKKAAQLLLGIAGLLNG